MQLFILLCVVAGAFAAEKCGPNSHYNECGTACPVTCENYLNPPEACILMCNPGCHCDEGYVKRQDGSCVLPEICATAVCGENKEYLECGTACPLTCDNYANPPKICVAMCKIGCQCKKGYVLTSDNRCVLPESCPSKVEETKSCLAKADEGMCRGYFPMYYYDAKSGSCKEFIYGGCGGNGNRYSSEEECLKQCGDVKVWDARTNVCDLPLVTGPCNALFHRYGFDKETGECKKFVYGGCRGNKNNFFTLQGCNRACKGVRVCRGENQEFSKCGTACPLTCDNHADPPKICTEVCKVGCQCKKGYVLTSDNQCILPENCPSKVEDVKVWDASDDGCDLPLKTGPCTNLLHRYGFDKATGECKKFVYGGCQGNKNNFFTLNHCNRVCRGVGVCRGENQEFSKCGTACPLTCDNYADPPKICTDNCKVGCQCKKGYVLTSDKQCILPENCPSKLEGVKQASSEVCELPLETGPCMALFHRYGFDKATGQCKKFVYGGCGGNKNNFRTLEACQSACKALLSGGAKACQQKKVVGPCKASISRFYFNKESRKCEEFIYGGCGGNDNNFETQEDCEGVCVV